MNEKVRKSQSPLHNSFVKLRDYWKRDKQMIRDSHVVLDITGPEKSEGVAHEIGFARYFLMKPVVRIYPQGLGPSIARLEDDVVVTSLAEAADIIVRNWGTPIKRLRWKTWILNRCFCRYLWTRLVWLIDWL